MSVTLAMINNTGFISHAPFPLIESTEKLTFFFFFLLNRMFDFCLATWGAKPWGLGRSDDLGMFYNHITTLPQKTQKGKPRNHAVLNVLQWFITHLLNDSLILTLI